MEVLPAFVTAVIFSQLEPEIKNSPCTLKIISNQFPFETPYVEILTVALHSPVPKVSLEESNLTDIPERYQTQRYQKGHPGLQVSKTEALRYTCNVEAALIFLNKDTTKDLIRKNVVQVNSNYKNFFIKALMQFPYNNSPAYVHHIFIGHRQDLSNVFSLYQIQVLRHKTGLIVSDGRVEREQLIEVPIEFTRKSTVTLMQFEDRPKGTFDTIRKRHFIVDSWPTKLHRITDEHGQAVGGVAYTFMKATAEYFNFTFFYKFDGYVIYQLPNNSWTGYLGHVMNDEADLSMFPAQTLQRFPFCDVTFPIVPVDFGLLTPIPRSTIDWKAIFKTFDAIGWLLLLLTIVTIIPVFYFGFIATGNLKTKADLITLSILNPLLMVIRTCVEQLPLHLRLLCLNYLMFCTLIGMFFDSNLTSFLTLPQYEKVPQTFQELADQSNYPVDFTNFVGGVGTVWLEDNKDPNIAAVMRRMRRVHVSKQAEELVNMTLMGNRVIFDYPPLCMTTIAQNLTLYPGVYTVKISEVIKTFYNGIGLRRYSKYTHAVNLNLVRLIATGHLVQWQKNDLELLRRRGAADRKKSVQSSKKEYELYKKLQEISQELLVVEYKPFTMSNVLLSFVCVIVGLVISSVAFAIEILAKELAGSYVLMVSRWLQVTCEGIRRNYLIVKGLYKHTLY